MAGSSHMQDGFKTVFQHGRKQGRFPCPAWRRKVKRDCPFTKDQRGVFHKNGIRKLVRCRKLHHMQPKPLQPGGVPLWISGTINPPMIRRLARWGAGWIPWGPDAADLLTSIPRLREAVAAAGGSTDFGVQGAVTPVRDADGTLDIGRTLERVPALVAAGVTDVRVPLGFGSSVAESVDLLAPVVAAFRELTA